MRLLQRGPRSIGQRADESPAEWPASEHEACLPVTAARSRWRRQCDVFVKCGTVGSHTVRHGAVQCSMIGPWKCGTVRCSASIRCGVVLCCAVCRCGAVRCGAVQCNIPHPRSKHSSVAASEGHERSLLNSRYRGLYRLNIAVIAGYIV